MTTKVWIKAHPAFNAGVFHSDIYIFNVHWFEFHDVVNVITGVLTANSTGESCQLCSPPNPSGTHRMFCLATYATALGAFIDLHPTLREQGLDGIWETSSPSIVVCLSQPFVNTTPTTAEQALKILANVSSIPGVTSTLQSAQFPTWLDAYTQAIVPVLPSSIFLVNCG